MSLLDTNSSTYCSTPTPRSLLTSMSPERQPGAQTQELELGDTVQKEYLTLQSSNSGTRVSIVGTEEGGEEKKEFKREVDVRRVRGTFDTKKAVVDAVTSSTPNGEVSVKDKMESAVEGRGDFNLVLSPALDDDGDKSSIKFVENDTASRASTSTASSSILFVRDPSVVAQREGSLVSEERNFHPQSNEGMGVTNIAHLSKSNELINNNERENIITKNETMEIRKTEPKCNKEKLQTSPFCSTFRRCSQDDLRSGGEKRQDFSRASSREGSSTYRDLRLEKEMQYERNIEAKRLSGEFKSDNLLRQADSVKRNGSQSGSTENSIVRRNQRRHRMDRNGVRPEVMESSIGGSSIHSSPLRHDRDRQKVMPSSHGVQPSPRRWRSAVASHLTDHSRSNNVSRDSCTPLRLRRPTSSLDDFTVVSPALERFQQYKLLQFPPSLYCEHRRELLSMLEDEMETVLEEMKESDRAMEHAMLRSPYERLYHMNNRRDRDERRSRSLYYQRLREARKELLAEDVETCEQRRVQQRESARRRNEVFERLHYTTPTRDPQSLATSRRSGRSESPSYVTNDAFFLRLYHDALESIAEKRERMRRAESRRQQEELEEMLHARILAHLELHTSPLRPRTPQQMEERASSIQQKLLQDPARLREFLQTNKLTKKEEELLSWRLPRQGLLDRKKLAEKKEQQELAECTFHPKTNSLYSTHSASPASAGYRRSTEAFIGRVRKEEDTAASGRGTHRSFSRTQQRACEQLYVKAEKRRERQKVLVEESQRAKKLAFLKSKLKEDHHFRRRAELDPSLAERYMASLVV